MKSRFLPICIFFSLIIGLSVFYSCNNKRPFKIPYEISDGIVIGKENCFVDTAKDYWLINLTVYPNTKQYGDTISLNGVKYTNVVKALGLKAPFNQIGKRVSLSFTLSKDHVQTDGCDVSSPVTYDLKILKIISEGYVP
ncbi:MAG: hypothetical protein ACRDE2_16315 [Chitinophagaceae bacterium]